MYCVQFSYISICIWKIGSTSKDKQYILILMSFFPKFIQGHHKLFLLMFYLCRTSIELVQVQVELNHRANFPPSPGYHGLPGVGASIHALSPSWLPFQFPFPPLPVSGRRRFFFGVYNQKWCILKSPLNVFKRFSLFFFFLFSPKPFFLNLFLPQRLFPPPLDHSILHNIYSWIPTFGEEVKIISKT